MRQGKLLRWGSARRLVSLQVWRGRARRTGKEFKMPAKIRRKRRAKSRKMPAKIRRKRRAKSRKMRSKIPF
ncbi:hypothetical protein Naga_102678g1 [Nannochloropsis gaditana]|uniref:Uncharacterized protein n=1 Tax=Nannochloropsis gaditana TaxID=72520 RepID=W7U7V3_9STRA|nr:hypothetical protein Naga_102678g1 [Nannochloropsis gaditana]